ncbi:preprotein translocase subunit SecG [Candidatus Parcubacteria bacterium 4484_255]|nr:MAG: preprotein translocase subunit SecG [Candidatus Parcubacteria bacterium 4484_255]
MSKILSIIQIVTSLLLVACILFQSREGGLSTLFGGGDEVYRTKRGLEKTIFIATIILAIAFIGLGIIRFVIAK